MTQSSSVCRVLATWLLAAAVIPAAYCSLSSSDDTFPVEVWPAPSRLGIDSRIDLAITRANAEATVDLLIAAEPGRNPELVAALLKHRVEVRRRDDVIDYLRVRVPLPVLAAVLENPAIEAVMINRQPTVWARSFQELRAIGVVADQSDPQSAKPSIVGDRPLREADANSPRVELNAAKWLADNPTFDGRGTVVGYSERLGGFDPLLPEIGYRTLLDGTPAAKIVGFRTSADPGDQTLMRWINMSATVTIGDDLCFVFGGVALRGPRAGLFRVGVLEEPTPGEFNGGHAYQWDLNQNGRLREALTVLWDDRSGEVWIDGDAQFDLRGLSPLHLREHNPDIGILGKDDPSTPWRESIGFTVQASEDRQFLVLNLGIFDHACLIGNVGANGGRFSGVAPGSGYTMMISDEASPGAFLESLIALALDELTDVIVGAPADGTLFDNYGGRNGEEFESIIMNRIVRHYRKAILIPGGNMPGQLETNAKGRGLEVVSVGGYRSKHIFDRNFGLQVPENDNIPPGADSAGPAADGGLKPDVLAPSGHVTSSLGFRRPSATAMPAFAEFPPGYMMGSGSSQAAPIAGGCYALLISGAKQRGLPYDPERLNFAVRFGARFLPGYQAYQQGNGLMDVEATWRLLEQLAGEAPVRVEVSAPVRTANSAFLRNPHIGRGLYEREGWSPGQSGERVITLKRTSGPAEDISFRLSWLGDHGKVFSTLPEISLPLNSSVALPVSVRALPPGTSSAILEGRGGTEGQRFRVLCTIVAADVVALDGAALLSHSVTLRPPRSASWFFKVPPGLKRLEMSAQSTPGVPLAVYLHDAQGTRNFFFMDGKSVVSPIRSLLSREDLVRIDDPVPGVWEALFSRPLRGTDIVHSPLEAVPAEATLYFNRGNELQAQVITNVSGSLEPGTQRAHRIAIPEIPDGKVLAIRIACTEGLIAPDVFALDVTTGKSVGRGFVFVAYGADQSAKSIRLPSPRAGEWLVIVDGANTRSLVGYTLRAQIEP